MSKSILLVDDDRQVLDVLTRFFQRRDWSVQRASTGGQALGSYDSIRPDLVLLDLKLPDASGIPLLHRIRERDPDATIVMLTGHGDIETAVEAMRAGAENFLTKPVDLDYLDAAAERALEIARVRRRNRFLTERGLGGGELDALGSSPRMRETAAQIKRVASSGGVIMLTGETGTGKGWAARLIHRLSDRADHPFVDVNCGGLSSTFLDSELFGHEKGAFTDAKERKRGLFEVADGGTIFLDEVGDLTLDLQPKLLKVLEHNRFRRIGGTAEIDVDVRLITATNHDLERAVTHGEFREDLYYRLNVLPIELPPLRERSADDFTELAHRLLAELHRDVGGPDRITDRTLALLMRHEWPGNVRELRNVLERMVILAREAEVLKPEHVPAELRDGSGNGRGVGETGDPLSLEDVERRHIRRTLERFDGNRSRVARELGISRTTLYDKIDRYGFEDVGRN